MKFQLNDRVELPYTNPLWQPYREGIVAEITIVPQRDKTSKVMIKVLEVYRRTWGWFAPESLKPWLKRV